MMMKARRRLQSERQGKKRRTYEGFFILPFYNTTCCIFSELFPPTPKIELKLPELTIEEQRDIDFAEQLP